jgi:hypothetical protein
MAAVSDVEWILGSDDLWKGDPTPKSKWRDDPIETLSDWILQVVATSSNIEADATTEKSVMSTYHLHRSDLISGTRKSEYFITLFARNFKETETNISTVELDAPVAAVVPSMLDYLYSDYLPPKLDMDSAMHLYSWETISKLINCVLKSRSISPVI